MKPYLLLLSLSFLATGLKVPDGSLDESLRWVPDGMTIKIKGADRNDERCIDLCEPDKECYRPYRAQMCLDVRGDRLIMKFISKIFKFTKIDVEVSSVFGKGHFFHDSCHTFEENNEVECFVPLQQTFKNPDDVRLCLAGPLGVEYIFEVRTKAIRKEGPPREVELINARLDPDNPYRTFDYACMQ